MSKPAPYANRLIHETSPYLLQHAHNPVDWYPWGPEALARAKEEDKPIFLSVGYSACHWCHVMERESFEDEATARYLNEHFVCIKVDREERPDLDAIYMDAVVAMTRSGGWPMSVFLTPEGKPFFGGTYFPPEERYGMPSFRRVLSEIVRFYREHRSEIDAQAERLVQHLAALGSYGASGRLLSRELLRETAGRIAAGHDPEHGGFGHAPKFPQSMSLSFLLRQSRRGGDPRLLGIVTHSLRAMAEGGVYDQLGGGFHRYSVDAAWQVPHFEKMLYDNALLAALYLEAYQATGDAFFARIARETLDYMLREMLDPAAGFYSTQDADSEGEEGRFFVWTPGEIAEVVGEPAAALVCARYGVTDDGNFEHGRTVLHLAATIEELSRRFGKSDEEVQALLAEARARLLAARQQRVPPGRDDKILLDWNGLAISALAKGYAVLGDGRYLTAAQQAADFILAEMRDSGRRLLRVHRGGRPKLPAQCSDYAAMIHALIDLYQAGGPLLRLRQAEELAKAMLELFFDPRDGGFYAVGVDHEALIVRRKDTDDNATPSGNSLATEALLRLARLLDRPDYWQKARLSLLGMAEAMVEVPQMHGRLLCALDFYLATPQEIVLAGEPDDPKYQALRAEVVRRFLPNVVLASTNGRNIETLPLLEGKAAGGGAALAYVCSNYACRKPTSDPAELATMLDLLAP